MTESKPIVKVGKIQQRILLIRGEKVKDQQKCLKVEIKKQKIRIK
jgi:hypothetical protein